jgi:hypothetical protein
MQLVQANTDQRDGVARVVGDDGVGADRVARSERGPPGEFADLENMSAEQLRQFVLVNLEALGIRPEDIFEGPGTGSPGDKLN